MDKASINKIRTFHLTFDRHVGRYQIYNDNYNQLIYNTKYYYQDQSENLFMGDEHYLRKTWKRRSPFKRYTAYFIILGLFIYLHSFTKDKNHRKLRRFYQENYNDQFSFKENNEINSLIKLELEGKFEEIFLSTIIEGYTASIILRIDDESCIKGIANAIDEFKKNMSDVSFKVCMVVLLNESFYKENIGRLTQTINKDVYKGLSNISFFCFNYKKDEITEKQLYFFLPESFVLINKERKGVWGSKVNGSKLPINNHHLKLKLGNLQRSQALEVKQADYNKI